LYSDKVQRLHSLLREELAKKYAKCSRILGVKDRAFDARFCVMRELLQMVAEDSYYCKISGGRVQPWLSYENLIYLLIEFVELLKEVPYSVKARHTINELLMVLSRLLDNFIDDCIASTSNKKQELEKFSAQKQSGLRAELEKLHGVCSSFGDREACYRIAVCVDAIAQLSKDNLQQNAVTEPSNMAMQAGEGHDGDPAALVYIPLQFGLSETCLAPVTIISVVSIVEILHRAFDTAEVPNWYRLTCGLYQALVLRLLAKGECQRTLLSEAQLIYNKSVVFLRRSNNAYYLSHILVDALHVAKRETKSMKIKFWCHDCMHFLYSCAVSGEFDHKLKLTSWDDVIQGAKQTLGSGKTRTFFQKDQASFFRSSNFKNKRIRKGKMRSGSAIDLRNIRVQNVRRESSAAASSSSALDRREPALNVTSKKAGTLLKIPSIILHIVSRLAQYSIDYRDISFPHLEFVEWFMVTYLGLSVPEGHVLEFNGDFEVALYPSASIGSALNESRVGESTLGRSRSVGDYVEESSGSSTALCGVRSKRQVGHSSISLLEALRDEELLNFMPSESLPSNNYTITSRHSRASLTRSRSRSVGDQHEACDRFVPASPKPKTRRNHPVSPVSLPAPVDQDSDDTIPSQAGATQGRIV
jgi:hypothetical protein